MPAVAPEILLLLPSAGSAVLTPPGSGGSVVAPSAVLALLGTGGSVAAPSAVLTLPGTGGSVAAPYEVLTLPGASSASALLFENPGHPERDGRYVYLGLFESVIPCWARDDGTTAIIGGILTGAGLAFIQRDNGSGEYIWSLEDGSDWASTSPSTLMTHLTATASRSDEPTPADSINWFDVVDDVNVEGLQITLLNGLTAPSQILMAPSAGGSAMVPSAVLTLPSAGGSVQIPRIVLRPPSGWPGSVMDNGAELTDGPDGTVTDIAV